MKTKCLLIATLLLIFSIASPANAGGKSAALEWLAVRMGLIAERPSAEAILKMSRAPILPERAPLFPERAPIFPERVPLNDYGSAYEPFFGSAARQRLEREKAIRAFGDNPDDIASDKFSSRLFREHALEEVGKDAGSAAEAAKANESLFKLGLDGKLEAGTLYSSKYLSVKGGEINVLRWGAAAGGAAYCKSKECFSEAVKKAIELDEKFGLKRSAKPAEFPN